MNRMRYFLGAILVALCCLQVRAEFISLEDLPQCAAECITATFPKSKCDSPTDVQCVCASNDYKVASATCLQANCTVIETLAAQRYFTQTCQLPVRDNSGVVRGVGWVLYAVTVICVTGRMLFRNPVCQGSGYGLDDWMIVISAGVLTPIVALVDEMSRHGLGKDIWMLTPEQISRILYVFWTCEILYAVLMATTKTAILLLYLRIWQADEPRNRTFRLICYSLIVFICCFALTFGLTFGLSCSPISYSWERWDDTKEGTCVNILATLYSCAAINTVMDFVICLLPIPKLAQLHVSYWRKAGISFIFSLGLFVTTCSIIRFKYLVQFSDTVNPTWDYEPVALWSCNESNLSVLLACIPAMSGLFQRLWRRGVNRYGSGSRSRAGHQLEVEEVALTGIREGKQESDVVEAGANDGKSTYTGW